MHGGVWASLTLSLSPGCGSLSRVWHSHARMPQAMGFTPLLLSLVLQVFATKCCSNSTPAGSLAMSLQDRDKNSRYQSLTILLTLRMIKQKHKEEVQALILPSSANRGNKTERQVTKTRPQFPPCTRGEKLGQQLGGLLGKRTGLIWSFTRSNL